MHLAVPALPTQSRQEDKVQKATYAVKVEEPRADKSSNWRTPPPPAPTRPAQGAPHRPGPRNGFGNEQVRFLEVCEEPEEEVYVAGEVQHGVSELNKRPSDRKTHGFNVRPAEHPSKRPAGMRTADPMQGLGPLGSHLRRVEVTVPLDDYLRLFNCKIVTEKEEDPSPSLANAARSLNLVYDGKEKVAATKRGTSVHITTEINDQSVRGILDSGATLSIMTEKTTQRLGLASNIKPSNATFVTANGEKVMATGVLPQTPVRVGGEFFPVDFQVTGATTFDMLPWH